MKIKIIGAGSIGNHLSHASRQLGHDVTLCDIDYEALKRTNNDIYPGRYGTWDDEIKLCHVDEIPDEKFDIIITGTPPDSHIAVSLNELDKEPKAMLIEKPACTPDLIDIDRLINKSKKVNCQMFIGYDHIVGNATSRFCELARDNIIGEALTLDVEFREHWAGIYKAHPWLTGPEDTYLGYWKRGGGATGEHSHGLNLWQHIASVINVGKITNVSAKLDYVVDEMINYDRLSIVNLVTDMGFVGRVVQDVVTKPAKKWIRLQGSDGYIELHISYKQNEDAIIYQKYGNEELMESFPKTRSDDFILELSHIKEYIENSDSSPISLSKGLDTMLVLSAIHKSYRESREVNIRYDVGYNQNAIN